MVFFVFGLPKGSVIQTPFSLDYTSRIIVNRIEVMLQWCYRVSWIWTHLSQTIIFHLSLATSLCQFGL